MSTKYLALSLLIASCLFLSAQEPASITQIGQFNAPNLEYQSYFGAAAVIAGDTIVISAPNNELVGGQIFIYEKPSGGWASTITPAATIGSSCNEGGRLAISADGSTIAATDAQCYGGLGFGATAVDVFVRPASGWQSTATPTAVVVNKNGGTSGSECGNNFGLSSDGKTLVCSDSFGFTRKNYLFFFDRPSSGWANTTTPNLSVSVNAYARQIALNGNTVVTESNFDSTLNVWQRTATGLKQLATLTTSDGASVGYGLATDAQTIAVQGFPAGTTPTKVYIFSKPASGWTNATETAQLSGGGSPGVGWGLAKNGNTLLAGSQGAAYVFFKPASGWTRTSQPNATILSTDPYQLNFGAAVAMQGQTIVIGDPFEGQNYNENGAAYIFQTQ